MPRPTKRLVSRLPAPSALCGAITLLVFCVPASADISDDFETYTAGTAFSTTATTNGENSWTGGTAANTSATVVSSADDSDQESAYSGTNFLRLGDSGSGAAAAYDKFFNYPQVPDSGLTIQFALRVDANSNSDQVVMFGYNKNNSPTSVTALEIGILGSSSNLPKFDWYTSAGQQYTSSSTVVANRWYLFNVSYSSNAANNDQVTYSFTVTDASTSSQVLSEQNLTGINLSNSNGNYDNISEVEVETSSSLTGNSDFDDMSITAPEPSCVALMAAGGAVLLRRRPRRRVANDRIKQ